MGVKIWMVTGAGRGFGKEIAKAALERGDAVVATARRPEQVSAGLADYGERLLPLRLDVTDEREAEAATAAAVAAFGRIDVLVHNAGRGLFGAVEETSPAEARTLFETNVFGVLAVTRAVLPVLRAQRSGRLVLMSSMGGFSAGAGFGVYAASKFALEGMAEALREELAPLGIGVVLVEPGVFDTGFGGADSDQVAAKIEDYAADPAEQYVDDEPPGDPALGAAAIVETVAMDDPPFRLPLGDDAVARITAKLTEVGAELAEYAQPVVFTTPRPI
ncbi:SDR family oxidoreductase [Amycolatopsis nigrescens]|uniref:SDR family oxidoreductase n=1 Tax=Amycolatopsis nigrescens TaxID=381445 RepID=UPI00058B079B|nr:SDR family oxidoreductase [Amycolatopsis nigrescens]